MCFESLKKNKLCKLEFHNAPSSLLGGGLLGGLLGGGGLLGDLLGGNLLGGDLLLSDFLCYTNNVISRKVSKVICIDTPIHNVLSRSVLTLDL